MKHLVLAALAVATLGACTPDPEQEARFAAQDSIKRCWSNQSKKSNSSGDSQFIAGVCEKMESDFMAQYKRKP